MSKLILDYKRELQLREPVDSRLVFGGAQNIFGSIAKSNLPIGTHMDFIPEDGNSHIIDITGTNVNAQWLGLGGTMMQEWAYIYCSPLAAVIDRLAEADTNGRISLLNPDGTVKEKYSKNPRLVRIMALLKNPNPGQTWEEFNSEQVVIAKKFGYCPVWAIGPYGFDRSYTKYLYNLNPSIVKPVLYNDYELLGIAAKTRIDYWTFSMLGTEYNIPNEDILLVKDGFVEGRDNNGLPLSKIAGLDYVISNICAAMEADNVLLKKKGPLGVFSHDPKPDVGGWQPLNNDDKEDMQKELQRYGLSLGQLQYIVSKTPIKWNSMSFNVQELMTKETVRQGIDTICDRFGYPAELMSGKNATYENRKSAEQFMYQSNIIPFSLRRMARYSKFFQIEDVSLFLDYDHLPVMQEDVMKAAQADEAKSKALDIEWKAGIIDFNEWRKAKFYPPVAGMDGIFYPEWMSKNKKAIEPTPQPKTEPKNETSSKDTGAEK